MTTTIDRTHRSRSRAGCRRWASSPAGLAACGGPAGGAASASSASTTGPISSPRRPSRTSRRRPASRSTTTPSTPTRPSRLRCSPAGPATTSSAPRPITSAADPRRRVSEARPREADGLGNLDPKVLALMAESDPGNQYAVPYLHAINGFAYNVAMVRERMPPVPDRQPRPDLQAGELQRFADCGVTFLDSAEDVLQLALVYLHLDPNTSRAEDYAAAEELMLKVRPYIRTFDSAEYLNTPREPGELYRDELVERLRGVDGADASGRHRRQSSPSPCRRRARTRPTGDADSGRRAACRGGPRVPELSAAAGGDRRRSPTRRTTRTRTSPQTASSSRRSSTTRRST